MPAEKLSIDAVRHVAKLARLAMSEEKLQKLTGQLESILGYVNKINQIDLKNVEPMAHALPLHNVLREDVVGPSLPLKKVLQNAPETDGPFFKVPKVIGGDEDSAGKRKKKKRKGQNINKGWGTLSIIIDFYIYIFDISAYGHAFSRDNPHP